MEEALEAYDCAASPKERAIAETVRESIDNGSSASPGTWSHSPAMHNYHPTAKGLLDVGLTIYRSCPVTIDGITYPTAMNAFQAMKAKTSDRIKYTSVEWPQAVQLGRTETIDVTQWDSNREELMHSILVAQASANPSFKKQILKYGNKSLPDNSMSDAYWPTVLPRLWARVRSTLKEDEEEEDEEEDGDDDEDEENSGEKDEEDEDDDAAEAAEMVRAHKRSRRL